MEYKPGKQNTVPDALSRIVNPTEHEPIDDLDEKIYNVFTEGENFKDQLREEQRNDAVIADAKDKVESGVKIDKGRFRHVQKQLRVEDGILMKSGRQVVPPNLRRFITEQLHDAAHSGSGKLYETIQKKFYWPNLYRYVQNHVSACEVCQKCKPSTKPPRAPLLPIQEPEYPMQFITLDIAWMVKDEEGYQYILLIGDLFSKYVTAVPLKDQTADTICNSLNQEWILVHGVSNFLLSDQGSNVDGKIMNEVCAKFGIEKRRTSAYHSQGNGFAERSIRNVKELFRTHLLANKLHQRKWRSVLKDVVFALNTTVSAATKCVPYTLVHGRDVVVPEDVKLGRSKDQFGRDIVSASDYAEELKLRMEKAFQTVNDNLATYRNRMKETYERKPPNVNNYAVDDDVWLRKKTFKTGESAKLAPRRTGPWRIVQVLPNGRNFKIKHRRNGHEQVVHHDRLQPVRSPSEDNGSSDDVSSSSDDSENEEPIVEDNPNRRYPLRVRKQRQVEGAIPWDAINDDDLNESDDTDDDDE